MGICKNCGKECIKHAKGMCVTCYKKLEWKPKPQKCKRCNRMLPHHAHGYCAGCYNTLFHLEYTKDRNYKKRHNISPELYREITSKCLICGFDKIVELHHLDHDRKNSSRQNIIGLCPNHHKMLHMQNFRDEIIEQISKILNIEKKDFQPFPQSHMKQATETQTIKEENSSE